VRDGTAMRKFVDRSIVVGTVLLLFVLSTGWVPPPHEYSIVEFDIENGYRRDRDYWLRSGKLIRCGFPPAMSNASGRPSKATSDPAIRESDCPNERCQ